MTSFITEEGLVPLLLCSAVVLVCSVAAIILIALKEGASSSTIIYTDDLWRSGFPCLHPFWLIAYRFVVFVYATTILVTDVSIYGFGVFFFYTQWSYLLLVIYFGVATIVSTRAASRSRISNTVYESRLGFLKDFYSGNTDLESKNAIATLQMYWETVFTDSDEKASFPGFCVQIMFQTLAGAAVLTDCVYWMGIFPVMKEIARSYDFLEVNLHGLNAVFIIGEIVLNRMKFPWFRGAYFSLWTAAYVLFQWSVHAAGGITWWPYPFLDPTQRYAPLWYMIIGIGHVMCYGLMCGVASIKNWIHNCVSS